MTAYSASIVEFLNARLAEDEEVAASNAIRLWPGETLRKLADYDEQAYALQPHDFSPERRAHVLRFDPARTLRAVGAKRRIIEDYVEAARKLEATERRASVESRVGPLDFERQRLLTTHQVNFAALSWAVYALALEFATHEDYQREQWAL